MTTQNTSHNFKPVRKAVFPVAGLGTRFLPATKVMPKEMLPINDRPLIQHVVEEAQEAGIEENGLALLRAQRQLQGRTERASQGKGLPRRRAVARARFFRGSGCQLAL